jgi:hypothetical protein
MFIIIFLIITILHYRENLELRREPPSDKWAKEVLLSSGDITDYPQLIKYGEKYIVAHVDRNIIKILSTDNLGNKLQEKTFPSEGDMPRNVHVVTNESEINLMWITNDGDIKNIHSLELDSSFNIKNEDSINNVEDLKQVGNNLLVIGLKNTIRLIDYRLGKTTEISAPSNSMLCGTKSGDKYIVGFLNNFADFCYFLVENGVASEIKEVGVLKENSRVSYYNSAIAIEGDNGYIFAEYRYQGTYGGSKVMEFALDGSSYNTKETADKDRVISIFNVTSYTENNNKGIRFLAGGYRPLGKKESYEDILNLELKNGAIEQSTPISRTRALSGFPSGYGDTIVFCDVVGINKSNLYMTSSREEFKTANNTNRNNEYILAFLDTAQSILFTFVYLIAYGALWIIPSFCIASVLSLIEYKLNNSYRKVTFISAYLFAFLLKAYFIYSIIFKKFRSFIPNNITPAAGIGAILLISIICCIYGYRRYVVNMERNAIALNFSPLFILDSWFTLLLFVPFIK